MDEVVEVFVVFVVVIVREGEFVVLWILIVVDGWKEVVDLIVGVGNDIFVGL